MPDSRPDTYAHIAQVRGLLNAASADLVRRGHVHDASKLEDPEVATFDEYSDKLGKTTYGTEQYERQRKAMGPALAHHYEANDHHPEHFGEGVKAMDLLQLTEMLADWIAASRRHSDGDIWDSIEKNCARFGIGPELRRLLENTVDALLQLEHDAR